MNASHTAVLKVKPLNNEPLTMTGYLLLSPDGMTLAHVYGEQYAQLFAVSPALLEACDRARLVLEFRGDDTGTLEALRAAIALAGHDTLTRTLHRGEQR